MKISSRNSQKNTYKRKNRQLTGQSSSTPFMNMREGYNSKKVVTFDMQDRLDDKIDRLTSVMIKLTAEGSNQNKPFKPNIYQGKRRGQVMTSEEVEVDLEKDNIQVILGVIKAVVVDQDQVQEPVLIEIGLGIFNVGNMII